MLNTKNLLCCGCGDGLACQMAFKIHTGLVNSLGSNRKGAVHTDVLPKTGEPKERNTSFKEIEAGGQMEIKPWITAPHRDFGL